MHFYRGNIRRKRRMLKLQRSPRGSFFSYIFVNKITNSLKNAKPKSQVIAFYPLKLSRRSSLRFPPRGPSLQAPPESPFPFRVERLPVRPTSSCSNKSFAFGTLGLADTGSHGGATKLNASFSPFPPYGPAGGSGLLRSCPHPGNPSDGGPGYARRGIPLS